MRAAVILCLGCMFVVGCASPSQPPKPSPYRYWTPERVSTRSPSRPVSIHL